MNPIQYRQADVDGFKVSYREAGTIGAPRLLLLHGFPSSSHMFRDLIPLLADRFHLVAPDLPGFGRSDMLPPDRATHTFDHLAGIIDRFTEVVGFDRFALYVFDYGAPTGFRIALRHPERVTAIVSQNGNAYEEGLSDGWNPIRAYWQEPSPANRDPAAQHADAGDDALAVRPRRRRRVARLARRLFARQLLPGATGADEAQLDLIAGLPEQRGALPGVPALFPHPPAALPRGLGRARSILPACRRAGLQARYSRGGDPPLRHGHFALETHAREIAATIAAFLGQGATP